jgi:RNA polymerase sigma-32 factor
LEAQQKSRLDNKGLEQALADLDARSRRIIEARWLRGNKAVTLHKLAEELGVSAERIRQIEVKALQKMRMIMEPDIDSSY